MLLKSIRKGRFQDSSCNSIAFFRHFAISANVKAILFILSFFVMSLPIFTPSDAADIPISLGETISESISNFGEIDKYIFDALAGDRLAVAMSTNTGLDPYFRIYAPDGSLIYAKSASGPGYAWIDTDPLPAIGTYILLGREEEARTSAAKSLEFAPDASVSLISKISTVKNQAFKELVADAMRKAGFPE